MGSNVGGILWERTSNAERWSGIVGWSGSLCRILEEKEALYGNDGNDTVDD